LAGPLVLLSLALVVALLRTLLPVLLRSLLGAALNLAVLRLDVAASPALVVVSASPVADLLLL
jgi:hypothetical protein